MTVASAFISARRERIILRVLSASGCAFKAAACVDVLRAFGKTDLDNTDVARDHFLSLYRERRIRSAHSHTRHVGLMVSTFQWSFPHLFFQLPLGFRNPVEDRSSLRPVRNTHAGGRRSASLAAWLSGNR